MCDHDHDDPSHQEAAYDGNAGSPGCLKLVIALVRERDLVAKPVKLGEICVHHLPRGVTLPPVKLEGLVVSSCYFEPILHS